MKHKRNPFSQSRYANSRGKRNASGLDGLPESVIALMRKQGKLPAEFEDKIPKKTSKAVKSPSDYAKTLYSATPEIDVSNLPLSVTFTWHGARLMTNNQMLHSTTYLSLSPFKKACHELARAAMLETKALRRFKFDTPVTMHLERTAKKMVDPDGVEQMFKFIVDGLVKNGLLTDDSALFIKGTSKEQIVGDYKISIRFTAIQ